ncbi:NADH:flavin oxidoreductase/NADH oxidase [Paenibacillus abyssi]|uniref:NADPH dehydrogenase n=1 Tax=Paenibacillus abyssi TaxID=1340531 RepID=A0A917CTD0_9BACL|nr:NADH:flavin oxidoreductase/NADH oxidase [Paenibacillus abyssi]GGF95466.1 NADPH dehydrogenase [Paenibacillus abyssi]
MNHLNTPFELKSLSLKNRIVMPPMCQYSALAKDGMPTDWHYVHYVSRAVGGAGLIIIEMTNVEPDGRITDHCLGLWSDEHTPKFARIIKEAQKYGAKVAIQIAHAGRKAEDAPQPVGPSTIAVDNTFKTPRALTTEEVKAMVLKYQEAARRALEAGVDTIELHGAHGYLIHQFHSPGINNRDDEYGKDLSLFGVEVIKAVKEIMPKDMPLIMRVSAVEYMDGGYDVDHMIEIASKYKAAGVDVFHVSTGGEGPVGTTRKPQYAPGYQVDFAKALKDALEMPVIAVGMLDDPQLAEATLAEGKADLVAVGRGMLKDPYWAVHALAEVSGVVEGSVPVQYERAY